MVPLCPRNLISPPKPAARLSIQMSPSPAGGLLLSGSRDACLAEDLSARASKPRAALRAQDIPPPGPSSHKNTEVLV